MLNLSNTSLTGLTTYNLLNTTSGLIDGIYTSTAMLCDGHTSNEILFNVEIINNELRFDNSDVKIYLKDKLDTSTIEYTKLYDRYSYNLNTKIATDTLIYVVESTEYIDILETGYKGHLITGLKWIDFEGVDVLSANVKRINNNKVEVTVTFKESKTSFKLESIGALNCVTQKVTFEVINPNINYPTSLKTITGVNDTNDDFRFIYSNNGITHNVSEVAGTPAFDIRYNFTLPYYTNFDHVGIEYFYDGPVPHNVNLEILNNSGSWIVLGQTPKNLGLTYIDLPLPYSYSRFNSSNIIKVRSYHTSSGNPTDNFYIDFVNLTLLGDVDAPIINLTLPLDGASFNVTLIDFNCTAYDRVMATNVTNVSLYGDFTGTWGLNQTTYFVGANNSVSANWTLNLTDVTSYNWNCYACDSYGNCGFASSNYTFSIDTTVTVSSTSYNMTIPLDWSTDFDISTTAGILLLFFYLAVVTVIFFLGIILKIPVLVLLSALMFFFLGFIISMKISILFGILCIFVGLITAISGALML